ncbi:protein of unknown function (plasmid) [Pseudorhizobium banfieldiae]|uniref:Uncharacterized protein n=1 Tax=Pseudorhizobium banfieldiae TaxID=1125847 RepID=L0NMJ8_9HYPH|nr:protein of unknown function [Pseudorhizobium banfieldiae]
MRLVRLVDDMANKKELILILHVR